MDRAMQLGVMGGRVSLAAAVLVPYTWVWREGGDLIQAQSAAFEAG
jgi:hypothetical protein